MRLVIIGLRFQLCSKLVFGLRGAYSSSSHHPQEETKSQCTPTVALCQPLNTVLISVNVAMALRRARFLISSSCPVPVYDLRDTKRRSAVLRSGCGYVVSVRRVIIG